MLDDERLVLVDTGPSLSLGAMAFVAADVAGAFQCYASVDAYRELLGATYPLGAASALDRMADTGLAEGTPVVAGSNDTTVELFGAGGIRPGQGAIKLATAGVLYRVVEGPSVNPPVSCYPHVIPGLYYTATGTNSCASAHRWLRDTVFAAAGAEPGADFARMDSLAGEAPPGSEGLLSELLSLPVEAPDPLRAFLLDDVESPGALPAAGSGIALAAGLALRGMTDG